MTHTAYPQAAEPSLLSSFIHHIIRMPAWHRHVLTIAAIFASVGVVGHVRQRLGTPQIPADTAPPAIHQTDQAVSAPRSGFVGPSDSSTASPSSDSTATDSSIATNPNPQPWYLSPQFLNVGGSVIGGFVIGWIARVFVKTVTLIAVAGVAILAGLSYFHVINVDMTLAHQQYDTAMAWFTDQASRLKDVAIAYLPVHTAGLFGTFLGFRRR